MNAHSVTPALRQWIIEQAAAGCQPEAVIQAMCQAGWPEAVAISAMERTLQEHLDQQAELARLPTPVPVPEIQLEDAPLYLDAGDRRVHVISAMTLPRVVVLGNFLSDEECDALIESARPRMARSLTVSNRTGAEEVHVDRTSNGMFFQRGENDLVTRIEARIARLVNWPVENGEGIQVLQYGVGAEYKPHYDYFAPEEPGTPTILQRGGQRVGTVVMYLSEPAKGGGTAFPDVGFEAAPKRGNAVFFSYSRAHPASKTLHGGSPVREGEKWIATKWMREREFK